MSWWITIIASLLSGLFGSIITMVINNRNEIKREKTSYKKHIFQMLIAFRGDVVENGKSTGNFILALNQVFVAFNDNKRVIQAFEKYRQDKAVDSLVTLYKEMAKDIGVDYSFANDTLFSEPLVDKQMTTSRP